LEPGINGQAWLIPRRDNKRRVVDCTFMVGYQGMIELALRHPMIKDIRSGTIFEHDPLDLPPFGSSEYIAQVARARLMIKDRGEPIGYWGLATTIRGGEFLEVLSAEEVKRLRGGKVGPQGKIDDAMRWMERKTAIKQALKPAPRSIEVGWVQKIDEYEGSRLFVEQIPTKIADDLDHPQIEAGVNPGTGEVTDPIKDPWDGPNIPQSPGSAS
jgi:recombination protein RecT